MILPDRNPAGAEDGVNQNLAEVGRGQKDYKIVLTQWPYNYPGGIHPALIKAKSMIDAMPEGGTLTIETGTVPSYNREKWHAKEADKKTVKDFLYEQKKRGFLRMQSMDLMGGKFTVQKLAPCAPVEP